MIVIGIVGAPAGGKSTVAARLQAHGATWLNADKLAHRCLALRPVRDQIRQRFGPGVLAATGFVDRGALGRVVFGADDGAHRQLKCLERIVHPPTRQLLHRRLVRAAWRAVPATVLDVPLLFESDWGVYCDAVWCVDTPRSSRLRWLTQRGWSPEQMLARERRQLSIVEKRRLSTDVIANDGDYEALIRRVDRLWQALRCRPLDSLNPEHCRPALR